MTLRQRQPRVEDPAYLAYVRTLPCLICARPGPNDPAHIRAAAPLYGKSYTGKGEKPDDKWVLPLCRKHHDAQHRESELGWWAGMGIVDPFAVAVALYANRPNASAPRRERARKARVYVRKPPAERKRIPPGPKLTTRSNWPPPGSRKLNSKRTAQGDRE